MDQEMLAARLLFEARLNVGKPRDIGDTPLGRRRIAPVEGGIFKGPRLSGRFLDGADWLLRRPDGVTRMDVRTTLETDDGALIYLQYQGMRAGPAEVLARIDRGEVVDAKDYYMRIVLSFETGAPQYAWLNAILAVGYGDRQPGGPIYRVFELL
ncbi:DUF3237 domain-containing protein [Ferrovibrio sp. MS7]|jgi:hypothetical protein|uniref:DUF3237 domain-containing protein n=1 Tax=Ferrovibrio TaxID=1231242 RepID=UPI001B6C2F37|nr:DUF3237 domain-containing protein [Ferrovibrio sp.]